MRTTKKHTLRKKFIPLSKNIRALLSGLTLILILLTINFIYLSNKIDNKFLGSSETTATAPKSSTEDIKETQYSILSLGNLIVHDEQIKGAKTDASYDFDPSFTYITDKMQSSNLTLGIVEGSFSGNPPSGYPYFNIPDEFLTTLKKSGVDIVNFASNHSIDSGSKGFKRSLSKIEENNLTPIGVRKNSNVPNYAVQNLDGHKIGFFSFTYKTHENNGESLNGIPIPSDLSPLINTFNYNNLNEFNSNIKAILNNMKAEGVEFIVASIHWGDEYKTVPNSYQKEMAKILNNNNIDVVLGGHPHVIQPYETLVNSNNHKTLVFYSQGNTLSNQCFEELGSHLSEDGIILDLTLGLKNDKLYLKEYDVIPTWVYREKKADNSFYHRIIPVNEAIKNRNAFNLSDDGFTRVNRSLEDTSKIIGKENLGRQQFN